MVLNLKLSNWKIVKDVVKNISGQFFVTESKGICLSSFPYQELHSVLKLVLNFILNFANEFYSNLFRRPG